MSKYGILERVAGVEELLEALYTTGYPHGDPDFTELLKTITLIQAAKRHQYGDYIEAREKHEDIAIFENFIDIKRKYVRLSVAVTKDYSFKDLAEGYLDIAIYGLLGLQLLFSIEGKRNVSESSGATGQSGD